MMTQWTQRRGRKRALGWLVGLACLTLVVVNGCKHRRSVFRPRIIEGEPVLIEPAPSNFSDVPETIVAPEAQPGTGGFNGGFEDEPGLDTYLPPPADELQGSEPTLELGPETESTPQPPPRDDETIPSGVDPSGDTNEDVFNSIQPPMSRRSDGTGAARTRRAALRTRVQALADDPIDLVQPPRADRPWRYIVMHHSARPTGGYARIDRVHRERGGLDDCGYHFVIGNGTGSPDGTIEVTRRWSEQRAGAHSRDVEHPHVNEYGIGICLVGDFERQEPTEKQVESARALVAYLQDRYMIDPDRVGTHAQLAGRRTVCPGTHFPADQILGRESLAVR